MFAMSPLTLDLFHCSLYAGPRALLVATRSILIAEVIKIVIFERVDWAIHVKTLDSAVDRYIGCMFGAIEDSSGAARDLHELGPVHHAVFHVRLALEESSDVLQMAPSSKMLR